MNLERKAQARECLESENAKLVFDRLCEVFPDAALFWNPEEGTAEFGLFPSEPAPNGFKISEVSITIA